MCAPDSGSGLFSSCNLLTDLGKGCVAIANTKRSEGRHLRSHSYGTELELESCGYRVSLSSSWCLGEGQQIRSVSGGAIGFALAVSISSASHRDPGFNPSCETGFLGSFPQELTLMHGLDL